MVMLEDSDVTTREVLAWKGLHLFHFRGSTCSQKLRVFLRLKGIDFSSHHVDLARKEHLTAYYMGINPRGLVPTLVHDGRVVIESNDILAYLEARYPEPALVPPGADERIDALLRAEDDLHLDIRTLTMRFVFPAFLTRRRERDIVAYERTGTGTVAGQQDPKRAKEAAFWRGMNEGGGITDAQARASVERFRATIDRFEGVLAETAFLAGPNITLVDIAWYIYARRLRDAGYPIARWHPRFGAWFDRVDAQPEFRNEVPSGGVAGAVTAALHGVQRLKGSTLLHVVRRQIEPSA